MKMMLRRSYCMLEASSVECRVSSLVCGKLQVAVPWNQRPAVELIPSTQPASCDSSSERNEEKRYYYYCGSRAVLAYVRTFLVRTEYVIICHYFTPQEKEVFGRIKSCQSCLAHSRQPPPEPEWRNKRSTYCMYFLYGM